MASLRESRLKLALSQRDLAKKSGTTQKTILDIELGRVEPKLKTMRNIANALGVGVQEIDEFRKAIEAKSAA